MKSEISIEQANTLTRKFIVLPVLLSAAVVFVLFYGRFDFSFAESAKHIGFWPWMLRYAGWVTAFIAAVAAGIFIHEGIHGLFIAMFARGGFSSLSFGYDKKTMSPYAHSASTAAGLADDSSMPFSVVFHGDIAFRGGAILRQPVHLPVLRSVHNNGRRRYNIRPIAAQSPRFGHLWKTCPILSASEPWNGNK